MPFRCIPALWTLPWPDSGRLRIRASHKIRSGPESVEISSTSGRAAYSACPATSPASLANAFPALNGTPHIGSPPSPHSTRGIDRNLAEKRHRGGVGQSCRPRPNRYCAPRVGLECMFSMMPSTGTRTCLRYPRAPSCFYDCYVSLVARRPLPSAVPSGSASVAAAVSAGWGKSMIR